MKALLCKAYGSPETLVVEEVPSPPVGPRQVRIAVHEAGVNFADTLIIAGRYQVKPPFPFSPGMEAAGIVAEVGSRVTRVKPGDRVMATCIYGGFAEEVCVDEEQVFPVPDGVSFTTAAVFPITYGTVFHALTDRGGLRPGEWLLVHGAGSGVGLNAVELGRIMGARVIACAGSPEKLAAAQRFGAEHLIDSRNEQFRDRVKEITGGRGADVVFDPVGGDVFDQSLRCIARGGRLLVVGFASGRIPAAAANLLLLKSCAVVGVNTAVLIEDDPELYRERFALMMSWAAEGKLSPLVSARFPLAEAHRAMAALLSREVVGRVTVTIRH